MFQLSTDQPNLRKAPLASCINIHDVTDSFNHFKLIFRWCTQNFAEISWEKSTLTHSFTCLAGAIGPNIIAMKSSSGSYEAKMTWLMFEFVSHGRIKYE